MPISTLWSGAGRRASRFRSCRGSCRSPASQSITRFTGGCGADLPRWIRLRLEELQFDKAALHDFGLAVVARLCETLLKNGVPGLHFYTINQAEPTLRLWKALALEAHA